MVPTIARARRFEIVSKQRRQVLEEFYRSLNPMQLTHKVYNAQEKLEHLAMPKKQGQADQRPED